MNCPHCHGKLPASGLIWKQRKRARGLCWNCPAPAVPGKTRCEACAAKECARNKAKYMRKRTKEAAA